MAKLVEKRLQELREQRVKIIASLHRLEGAITILEQLLQTEEAEESLKEE